MALKPSITRIKKIAVGKSDEVALVVEKIIDSEAKEIVLNIPRFSKLSESLSNFHLISREAKMLKKKILIESVDDKVIELANLSGLESLNPILSRSRRQFYDIVSSKKSREDNEEDDTKKRKLVESVQKKSAASHVRGRLRNFIGGGAVLAVIIVVGIVASNVLPRADIKIITKKQDWIYKDSVKAEKSATVDSTLATVPGQAFIEKKTEQLSFPASGKKNVQQKATGVITIFNAYSSDPQPLVATTRFIAPDGKIFRLSQSITVPAAKIVEGKIVPSSLDAAVVADQPGPAYNIGPVSYFSIPGFKGTPKYQAFYGESKSAMINGFVGEAAFPTDADLKKAKLAMSDSLKKGLQDELQKKIPADFKIIEGASSFSILKQDVAVQVDSVGKFSISADGQLNAVAFKEADVIKMLNGKINKDKGAEYIIKSQTLGYGVARADFVAGRASFPIDFKGTIARKIDVESLKTKFLGKSESEMKGLINQLPELNSATISLWPFWVTRVPNNLTKLTVVVE